MDMRQVIYGFPFRHHPHRHPSVRPPPLHRPPQLHPQFLMHGVLPAAIQPETTNQQAYKHHPPQNHLLLRVCLGPAHTSRAKRKRHHFFPMPPKEVIDE